MANVSLKTKKLKSGRLSYYLQYYDPDTKKRWKEYLGLYLITKPKDEFERTSNRETKSLAQRVHSKKLLEYQEGRFGFRSKDKVNINFLSYFESIMNSKKNDSSNSNFSNYRSSLIHIRKYTRSDLKLSEIDHSYLRGLKDYLLHEKLSRGDKKLSQNTALSYFNNILSVLRQAHLEGLILEDPGKKIKSIKPVESHREFLTEEEIQKLFKTDCKLPIIKRAFLFGCLTGLRFSDIVNLEWKDVHQSKDNGWYIRFQQQKTNGSETLHITDQARELMGIKSKPSDRVFKGLKYSAQVNKVLNQWVMEAGITKSISFHCSRHSHAVLLLSKGVDIFTVSKILGHRDIKTTLIYAKVLDTQKIDAVKKIPIF